MLRSKTMSLFDSNRPVKETNKNPKLELHSGDGNQKPTSLFRHKPVSYPKPGKQPDAMLVSQSKTKPDKSTNLDLRLRTLINSGNDAPSPKPKGESSKPTRGERTRRAFWDVTTGFSLIVNATLVAILLIMSVQIRNLKTTVNGLLSGLYGNFVEMDNASINTTITVNTQVPIDFILPIHQNTDVILTQNVVIPNAFVVINSGGLSINAAARVTLPAGTNLPISLNMSVPVQSTIPVTLQVPVNIPLAQTELHQPFTGLQDTLRPYYCLLDKNAQYPQGIYICENHDIPTSTPGVP
jgi:hypothetical protein